jgi:hypothetical protein
MLYHAKKHALKLGIVLTKEQIDASKVAATRRRADSTQGSPTGVSSGGSSGSSKTTRILHDPSVSG